MGKMFSHKNESILLNQTSYITSEKYHELNRNSSDKYIIRSTSTIFYDLDTLVKRHSYHCVPQYPTADCKLMKRNNDTKINNKNGFRAKSEAIVQECATQIQPKLKKLDSLKITSKKIKKKSLNDCVLSSEMFLRHDDYTKRISDSHMKNKSDLGQKFWSYAKYKTEYTNPIPEVGTKERGKRTEDPCPCQLFSYACPCTDKKSLTELAKNSKSLTVADQITSTPKFLPETKHQNQKCSKNEICKHCDDKPTNTDTAGPTKKYEIKPVCEEPVTNKNNTPKLVDNKHHSCTMCLESKSQRKPKQVICPNCKEKLDIFSTEDEDGFKLKKYPRRRNNETSSLSVNQNDKNNNVDESEVCVHDPPCELVPLCQILPTDNVYNTSPKCVRRVSLTKHNPKRIRITKACRHHPPCLVVPSCQRLNVLNNKCKYIPACFHRPRCVNVPLCVPFYKSLNYDDILNKKVDDTDDTECDNFSPICNLMSAYQEDTLNTNQTCEYVSDYSTRVILNPYVSPTFLPGQVPNELHCKSCKSNKSCQFDCLNRKRLPPSGTIECANSKDVIYIRDVGCQFRSENIYQNDSLLHYKTSSTVFDVTSAMAGKYHSNYHALRYEDKCTNPISGQELSMSTSTTSSLEIDSLCPSHGIQAKRKLTTGFKPQSTAYPFVTAFSTYQEPYLPYLPKCDEISRTTSKSDSIDTLTYLTILPANSQRSSLKGKHKKIFSSRQRKKSKRTNTTFISRRTNSERSNKQK